MKSALRWLLLLFPQDFRQRYSDELLDLLQSKALEIRTRRGRIALARFWLFQILDLFGACVLERLSHLGRPRQLGRRKGERSAMTIWKDIRYALRTLRLSPVFAVATLVTLSLGIGATTVIFSIVDGILLRPLPFEEPDRLVAVWHRVKSRNDQRLEQSLATYLTYRNENRVFEDFGIWAQTHLTVTGVGEPEQVDVQIMTEGVMAALRVQPIMGRPFTSQDMLVRSPVVLILSNGYWQSRFGGDTGVVGQEMQVNGVPATIIGVMPKGFRFHDQNPQIYFPFRHNPSTARMGGGFGFQGVARLKPGVSIAAANRDVARMLPLTVEQHPAPDLTIERLREFGLEPDLIPLKQDVVGNVGSLLWILFATVGLVLLIASANVANLLLARAETRRRDVAVRRALGASRTRLLRQFLTESLVLGVMGGGAGLLLALGGLHLVLLLAPANLPRANEIAIDPMAVGFAFGASIIVGLAFGILPLCSFRKEQLGVALAEWGRGLSAGRRSHSLRSLLAGAEVTLAVVLLIGAGLMVRSFVALQNVDPGFRDPEELLTFRLTIPSVQTSDPAGVVRIYRQLLEDMAPIPGVLSVAATSTVPLDQRSSTYATYVEGVEMTENEIPPSRRYKFVSGNYFATVGNGIVAGRSFTRDDVDQRSRVVIVTQNFAREYWGDPPSALGKRIRNNPRDPWREIVGVVGDVRDDGLSQPARAIIFWPLAVEHFDGNDLFVRRTMGFVIRSAKPLALLPVIRQVVAAAYPNLPLADVRTLDDLVSESMSRTSFSLVMLAIAAVVSVLLGTVGIFGVVSYLVTQRTRELGVRIALGAHRFDIHLLVFRQATLLAIVGISAGLLLANGLSRFMTTLLYGVPADDPATYMAAAIVAATVVIVACYIPSRRAARMDPVAALRSER